MEYQSNCQLLDFVGGKLSPEEETIIRQQLEAQPIDKSAIEGIRLIYEQEGLSRAELEDMLQGMQVHFESNLEQDKEHLPSQRRKRKFRCHCWRSLVPVLVSALMSFQVANNGSAIYDYDSVSPTLDQRKTQSFKHSDTNDPVQLALKDTLHLRMQTPLVNHERSAFNIENIQSDQQSFRPNTHADLFSISWEDIEAGCQMIESLLGNKSEDMKKFYQTFCESGSNNRSVKIASANEETPVNETIIGEEKYLVNEAINKDRNESEYTPPEIISGKNYSIKGLCNSHLQNHPIRYEAQLISAVESGITEASRKFDDPQSHSVLYPKFDPVSLKLDEQNFPFKKKSLNRSRKRQSTLRFHSSNDIDHLNVGVTSQLFTK